MDIQLLYKQLWSNWDVPVLILLSPSIQIILSDVRILILLSLSIQIILIFLGLMRRTFNSRLMRMILWGSYLFADWVAIFVLGKLSHNTDDSSASNDIIAFWAPFLILHLGGPDTITAYSMEDNELWGRHLLGLIYELIIAFYVLIRSFPNSQLLAPTILMFLVAIIKYAERSYSLYKASIKGFRSSISINSFNRTYSRNDMNNLNKAFWLYWANKSLFIDVFPNTKGFYQTLRFMRFSPPEVVFEVISMELSYAYDEFYTKAIVSHSRAGYFLRVLCSICILLAFSLFVIVPKDNLKNTDVAFSYVLLIASICLDVMAGVLLVFSNWMVVSLLNVEEPSDWTMQFASDIVKIKRACHKRRYWMIKMPQLNLLNNCLTISTSNKAPRERIMNWVAEKLDLVQHIKLHKPLSLSDKQQNYTLQTMQPIQATQVIFKIITSNLERLVICIGRQEELNKPAGISTLEEETTNAKWAVPKFVELFKGMPLDQQVLVWHITTNLCFHCNREVKESTLKGEMEACKHLSDYMMHIVLMQSDMSSIQGGESTEIFWKTVNQIVEFIRESVATEVKELCEKIKDSPLQWDVDVPLFTTSKMLAHLIFFIAEKDRWRVMATVWTDLLIKVAYNSRASIHVKQLSRGEELLSLIWLFCKQLSPGRDVSHKFTNVYNNGSTLHEQIELHRTEHLP